MFFTQKLPIFTIKITHKNSAYRFLDKRSSLLDIKSDFNIVPIIHPAFRGQGIYIFLCVVDRQGKLSEIREVGNYCVSNKVPGSHRNL